MHKSILFLLILFVLTGIYSVSSCTNTTKEKSTNFSEFINRNIDTTLLKLNQLDSFAKQKKSFQYLAEKFTEGRFAYKKIESVVEYYFQGLTKRINGPALPDVKTDDNQVWPPHGFQVLEQLIYSPLNDSLYAVLQNEINVLMTDFNFVKTNLAQTTILPRHNAELVQHQLIRIATIGITGADAPLSKLSLQEAAFALKGLKTIESFTDTLQNINYANAIAYLERNTNFDSFNRMEFIQNYLMPLSEQHFIKHANVLVNDSFAKPFTGSLSDLLKGKKINPDYFTAYAVSQTNLAKVELGKKLFFETQLSKTNKISCATCHKPDLYFTDGLAKANDFVHGGILVRNTPTLYYASLQNNQFYDLRSNYLEDQINEVMKNSSEFNFSSAGIATKIIKNDTYKKLFSEAFSTTDSISGTEVRNAIAAFIRSLNKFSSSFDEYMNGDKQKLTSEEISGFNLFAGKAKCATCHFIPFFNGTIPPWYNKTESEIIGVPTFVAWQNATIDKDLGRYNLNKLEELKYAFKTPTVRNIEKTAPYMHNGAFKNLEDVVEFYHKGGGVGIGINLPFQSLPFDSLILNHSEKKAIVAFMKTLTDKKIAY